MADKKQKDNVLRTILLGLTVSLLGFFIMQFILDKKNNRKEDREKRQANQKAWDAGNDYIKSAQKKFQNIACFSCDYSNMKNEIIREIEQDRNSLLNLKEETLIDQRLKTIIDRTIGWMDGMKINFINFFDSLVVLKKEDPENKDAARVNSIMSNFYKTKERIDTIDDVEIKRLLSEINKEYKLNLEEKEYEPEVDFNSLPGNWLIECTNKLQLFPDGKLALINNGVTTNGSWSRKNYTLNISLATGENYNYIIEMLDNTLLRLMPQTEGGFPIGACRQH